jgi:SulP family sulfate permease
MVHAVTLLAITLFVGRWAALVPMACLAGILAIVCYHMSEWRTFRAELRSPRSDVAVLLVTFGLTVVVSLAVAIEVGMVLAAFLFMRRMAEVAGVSVSPESETIGSDAADVAASAAAERGAGQEVEIYEINGPLFFGAASTFKQALADIARRPRVLILRMGRVPAIDATGLRTLADIVGRFRREGTLVILSELHAQTRLALGRSAVFDDVGEENIVDALPAAITMAREYVQTTGLVGSRDSRPVISSV